MPKRSLNYDDDQLYDSENLEILKKLKKNYWEMFNQEVRQFMNPISFKSELYDSFIHFHSKVKYLEDNIDGVHSDEFMESDDDSISLEDATYDSSTILGTHWNTHEKEIFFYYLSRYSIHRLDEWYVYLPGKSKFEILTYFHILKTNLIELKRLNTKKKGGILKKEELPIAYEMYDFFIELEEKFASLYNDEDSGVEEYEWNEESLINFENWYKRWIPIYYHHRIEEYQPPPKSFMLFSKNSILFLENLVKEYTRNLLFYTVIPFLEKKFLPKDIISNSCLLSSDLKDRLAKKKKSECNIHSCILENDDIEIKTSNFEYPHLVTIKNVINAMVLMRSNSFVKIPTLPETIMDTLAKFEIKYQDGKLFKNKSIPQSLNVPILQYKLNTFQYMVGVKNLQSSSEHLVDKKIIELSSDKKNDIELPFIADSPINLLDNPLYDRLFEYDTDMMNIKDELKSKIYQHTILTYLNYYFTNEECERTITNLEPLNVYDNVLTLPKWLVNQYQYDD